METFVFLVSGAIVLAGALGVVLFRNTAHAALSLVATLFGVAVLFVAQEAHFLAAVQVIVYAGAIVVLFLFVLMLLGVDNEDDVATEPVRGLRVATLVVGAVTLVGLVLFLVAGEVTITGQPAATAAITEGTANVVALGRALFTTYVFAFEVTAVLLTIAVVGAVMLVRRPRDTGEGRA
ncbi:MAG TPA: NADH-quinone oxidoreductase subunit J [Acidimicrobiales bacterium]|nr:NADH-quinone oxidoreductase subunit J [Acidimicrobiales bacterium]